MKTIQRLLILFFLLFGITSAPAFAQEQPKAFALPEGRTSEPYQADIESVLRDTYRLKLETTTRTPVIQWVLAEGELTPGLALRSDGLIMGTPRASGLGTYSFKLRAVDRSAIGFGVDLVELFKPKDTKAQQ